MKFSDALRGAADRAPVDDLRVSTRAVSGRIKRERALRTGVNGLVGAGAVAVIAVAAVNPLSGGGHDTADESAEAMASAVESGVSAFADSATEDDGMPEALVRNDSPWMCGTDFNPADGQWTWGDTSGVTYSVGDPVTDDGEVQLPSTLEFHRTVDLIGFNDYVITWDGMVVGHMVNPETLLYGSETGSFRPDGQVYERFEPGSDFESWNVVDPVNCWDGAALPAGDYEIYQAWTLAYVDADLPVASDSGEAGDGLEVSDQEAVLLEPFRVAAAPVVLSIDGDLVDDPFAKYLGGEVPVAPMPLPEPVEPEPLPEGSLTPELARELFDANVVDGTWDMAPGSQRWVMTQDSQWDESEGQWEANYFGCVWGSGATASFPARSADLGLLNVDVSVPARISVSYGFVVDNNPLITSSVTNASDYTLSGLWGGAQPQLVLVQGGKVMATATLQGIDPVVGLDATSMAVNDDGVLEPGARLSGDFLWRDVHGCNSSELTGPVARGTYTVLVAHSVSLSNFQGGYSVALPEAANGDVAISPAPDQSDWVELQSWTSLGTLTVS